MLYFVPIFGILGKSQKSKPWLCQNNFFKFPGLCPEPCKPLKRLDLNFNYKLFNNIYKYQFIEIFMLLQKHKILKVKVFVHLFQKVAESETEPQGFKCFNVLNVLKSLKGGTHNVNRNRKSLSVTIRQG